MSERDDRYNHSEKGRARWQRYYHKPYGGYYRRRKRDLAAQREAVTKELNALDSLGSQKNFWPSRDPSVPHPGKVFYAGEWRTPTAMRWKQYTNRRWHREKSTQREAAVAAEIIAKYPELARFYSPVLESA